MAEVKLRVYDLTGGMAKGMSLMLTGIQIDAVYHTSLEVFGYEYFYGGGIQRALPGSVQSGQLLEVVSMGHTECDLATFESFLKDLAPDYSPEKYDLFKHNCNNFTDECLQLLVAKNLPSKILGLPQAVLNTPFGKMIKPIIDGMSKSSMNAFDYKPNDDEELQEAIRRSLQK